MKKLMAYSLVGILTIGILVSCTKNSIVENSASPQPDQKEFKTGAFVDLPYYYFKKDTQDQ